MYKNVYTAKGHHVKQNKANTERQVLHVFSYRWKLDKDLKRGYKGMGRESQGSEERGF